MAKVIIGNKKKNNRLGKILAIYMREKRLMYSVLKSY